MEFDYKKSLGQNFLIDKNKIQSIINSINPNNDDLIVEIGPGSGALTKQLINKGCDVICFEIDERLKEKLYSIKSDNLKINFIDFLKVDLKDYIPSNKYKDIYFVGNLPYYITTAIVNKITSESTPKEIIIMVQKEVGERFMAKPCTKKYNSLSVFLQYNYDITKICDVNKHCFEPIPKVDSVVIKLKSHKKYNNVDIIKFNKLLKDSFQQKRKNIKNNLQKYDISKVEEILKKYNKTLISRAEELPIEAFVELSNKLL